MRSLRGSRPNILQYPFQQLASQVPKEIHPYAVLLRPLVTEKTTVLTALDKYVFEVDARANKAQIREAEQSGAFSDHVTIYAPIGGTVIERMGFEGMYVEMGDRIYTIADLSEVWVKLDAYESDLAWLHYGQKVSFGTDACPGERFTGRIAFIDPILNPVTRTVKVRVNERGSVALMVRDYSPWLGGRIYEEDFPPGPGPFRVDVNDRGGQHTVDSGPGIDPYSLTMRGRRVSWTHDGQPRTTLVNDRAAPKAN